MLDRIDYIDSLRGFAALSVCFSHFALAYNPDYSFLTQFNAHPIHFLWDGAAAVSLFFVLSGFVLSLKYFNKNEYSLSLLKFYIARIFRLMLPFIVCLLMSYWAYQLIWHPYVTQPEATAWLYNEWSSTEKQNDSTFWAQFFLVLPHTSHFYVPQAWTLSLELQLSLLLPLLMIWLKHKAFSLFLLLSSLILFEIYHQQEAYSLYIITLFHFSLGIVLAKYFYWIRKQYQAISIASKCLLWTLALLLYSFRYTLYPWLFHTSLEPTDIFYATALGSAMLIALLVASNHLQKLLNLRAFVFIGKVSYAIYLLHFLVLLILVPAFIHYLNTLSNVSEITIYYLTLLVFILVTVLLSILFYFLIERPSIHLGHSLGSLAYAKYHLFTSRRNLSGRQNCSR